MGHWASGSCYSDGEGGLSLDYTATRASKKVNIKAHNIAQVTVKQRKGKCRLRF